MKSAMHPHAWEDVQHAAPILEMHEGHDIALHDPDPLEEVDVFGAAQLPPLQTWLAVVQSSHTMPPVPQLLLAEPGWHMLFRSQHPWQFDPEHPGPLLPLLPLPDPLPDPPPDPLDPPSSPGTPLLLPLLALFMYPMLGPSDTPELLAPLPVLDPPDEPNTPDEPVEELVTKLPTMVAPGGSGSPAAHEMATIPAASATSLAVPPRTRLCIPRSVRGVGQETMMSRTETNARL